MVNTVSINDLFDHITALVTDWDGFFLAIGLNLYADFAVCLVVWFGIQWTLAGGMSMDRFASMLMKLSICFAMIHFYVAPLGIFGGRNFHQLITDGTKYLADQLNNGITDTLFTSLDSLWEGIKQPGLTSVFNFSEIFEWGIVFLVVLAAEGIVYVVIGWGYIACAVCVILGPVLIPFYLVPDLDWIFWGWLKSFIQYSFYPVVANAVVLVLGRLLTNYIADHAPPYDGAQQWALLFPMLVMVVAFTFGVFRIPTLVNDIFTGRAGSSALPWNK